MALKDLGSTLVLTQRRRVVATAIVYGLSLTVRFTSSTGEETAAQAAQGGDPMTSIMINDRAQRDWLPGFARPVAFRRSAAPYSSGCNAACETPTRMPFASSCVSQH
ncbi:hypothetical protein JQ633_07760 [Bradyrhizobium tropiciagri]|uniref:hypothetical protein n=1 Tax=Bradyrhizobium tropiciagri TaxID=312253 RepID=UPI001BA6F650|nr:hypothetical protein [Bradyrhizobium tropiciagri]MBR0870247.1 hypothetical protein [Bradyrhizobium tropiciagri]